MYSLIYDIHNISMIDHIKGNILQIYTHVNFEIGPVSIHCHHNIYVGKSYVWVQEICCHPSLILRYVHNIYRTICPSNCPVSLPFLSSVLAQARTFL